ncbi:MAG: thioredoxin family protein [Planctomycetes bacterium]|nr:thioredoxin family protein [Planctomycetota bacterium]
MPNYNVGRANPTLAEEIDLGELRIPKPYRPPTLEEYVAKHYLKQPPEERLERGLKLAELGSVRLLVIAAEPNSDAAQQFFRFQYDYTYDFRNRTHKEVHRLLNEFIHFSLAPSESGEFLAKYGVTVPTNGDATFAVFKSDGSLVSQTPFGKLTAEGHFEPQLLADFLSLHRHPPLSDARQQLDEALSQAARENKRVLVQVGGPACGACYVLSQYLDGQRELIGKDYVHLKLDTRMPDFAGVYEELSEGQSRGVPWMVILDADGTTLITGDSKKGNIGHPIHKVEIDHFERMLRTTRQRLSDDELTSILLPLREKADE